MDLYLRAIGFSRVKSKHQIDRLVQLVLAEPDEKYILGKSASDIYVEYYKQFGKDFGLVVKGTMDENEKTTITHCQPFTLAAQDMSCCYIETEPFENRYIVISEDEQSGNELVFHLQNEIDFKEHNETAKNATRVNIGGLCLIGTIILPVAKNEMDIEWQVEEEKQYRELVKKARHGDKKARELLSTREAETTEVMRERLVEEDFLSVVEGFLLPNENNDTAYSILGDIKKVESHRNSATGETVYRLLLNVTGTEIEVMINKNDLTGLPMAGMRFMGGCWLQGRVIL